jgi:hypothetical protein
MHIWQVSSGGYDYDRKSEDSRFMPNPSIKGPEQGLKLGYDRADL